MSEYYVRNMSFRVDVTRNDGTRFVSPVLAQDRRNGQNFLIYDPGTDGHDERFVWVNLANPKYMYPDGAAPYKDVKLNFRDGLEIYGEILQKHDLCAGKNEEETGSRKEFHGAETILLSSQTSI